MVDPLISAECAEAALKLYREHRGQDRTIRAVIFTHSHLDHYGGVLGLFENGVLPDGVDVIAPDGFLEHAVSENVYAGNAMQRRAMFMYGPLLKRSAQGQVDAGWARACPPDPRACSPRPTRSPPTSPSPGTSSPSGR
ncbi:MBL fold metallo-hydrolase [Streptomyces sp. M19]